MKIAVTGATGFVGRYLVPQLVARGHEVTAMVRNTHDASGLATLRGVRLVPFDLLDEATGFCEALGLQDAVVHLAWPGLPNYMAPFHFEENLPLSYQFIKKCLASGIGHILVTGTCFEYGMRDGCLREDAEAQPANSYALAKDCLRRFLETLRKQVPFKLQWARLFYMFGEGQNSGSLLSQLDRAIDNGDAVFNMSAGEQLRDYLPVEEVARRLALLIEHPEVEGITNICSGKPISVRRLVEQRISERNACIKLNLGHYPYAAHEPMAFWGDARRFASIEAGE